MAGSEQLERCRLCQVNSGMHISMRLQAQNETAKPKFKSTTCSPESALNCACLTCSIACASIMEAHDWNV